MSGCIRPRTARLPVVVTVQLRGVSRATSTISTTRKRLRAPTVASRRTPDSVDWLEIQTRGGRFAPWRYLTPVAVELLLDGASGQSRQTLVMWGLTRPSYGRRLLTGQSSPSASTCPVPSEPFATQCRSPLETARPPESTRPSGARLPLPRRAPRELVSPAKRRESVAAGWADHRPVRSIQLVDHSDSSAASSRESATWCRMAVGVAAFAAGCARVPANAAPDSVRVPATVGVPLPLGSGTEASRVPAPAGPGRVQERQHE